MASQFIPDLARRSGCFVTVEPQKSRSGAFSATKNAINSLSDALTQRLYVSKYFSCNKLGSFSQKNKLRY